MAFNLFDRLRDALDGDDEQRINNPDVLPASQDPYGDPADQEGGFYNNAGHHQQGYDNGAFGNVLPASEDPYGDPADNDSSVVNVMPASMDPYGDPADQEQGFGNVRPASEDPYGDPADEGQHNDNQGIVGNVLGRIFGR
jgi:hypothetical protein